MSSVRRDSVVDSMPSDGHSPLPSLPNKILNCSLFSTFQIKQMEVKCRLWVGSLLKDRGMSGRAAAPLLWRRRQPGAG